MLEPGLHIGDGVVGGDVVQGHGPLGLAAQDLEPPVVGALDLHALGLGAVDDERLPMAAGLVQGRSRLLHQDREPADQRRQALAGDGRDPLAVPVHVGIGHVGLGTHRDARPLRQLGPVPAQLLQEHSLLLVGRPPVRGSQVDHHDQGPGPLDVA